MDIVKISTARQGIQGLFGVSLYRNSIYLMVNSAVLALTGCVFWAVASRIYPAAGIGLASAAISATGLLALLSTFGLDYGLIRFLPNAGEKANRVINSCFTMCSLISIALSLAFLAGLKVWSPALMLIRENPIFLAAFVIFTVATTLMNFTRQTFIAKRRAEFALAQELVFGILRFVPLIILAALFQNFGIFASWGIALGAAAGTGILLFLPRILPDYIPLPALDRTALSKMRHFSFANYATNLLGAAPGFIFPIMVANLLGAESNAYFYIAWTLGNLYIMIPRAASLSLFAEGSHDENQVRLDIKRSLKLILAFLIPAIAIIFLAGDKILLLFGGAYSENATRLLQILAFCAMPASIAHIYVGVKRVHKQMKAPLILTALTTGIALVSGYYLLPGMGITAVGIAWLTSQTITALGMGYKLYRIVAHS